MSDDPHFPSTTDPLDEIGGRALVEAWLTSGLSGAAFCREHELRPQRLHYWRERLGYPIKIAGPARLASVAKAPIGGGFVQMVVRDPAPPVIAYIEIIVGGHHPRRSQMRYGSDARRRHRVERETACWRRCACQK